MVRLEVEDVDIFQFANTPFTINAFFRDLATNQIRAGETTTLKVLLAFEGNASAETRCKEHHPNLLEVISNSGIREDGRATIVVKIKDVSMRHDHRRFVVYLEGYRAQGNQNIIAAITNPITTVTHKLVISEPHTAPYVWYKDEGAKDKCIEVAARLVDASNAAVTDRRVPLTVRLIYSSGQTVSPESVLTVFPHTTGATTVNGNRPPASVSLSIPGAGSGQETIRFRVNEVSRNHRKQLFHLLVSADVAKDEALGDISPATSVAFEVKSKRTSDARKEGVNRHINANANNSVTNHSSANATVVHTSPSTANSTQLTTGSQQTTTTLPHTQGSAAVSSVGAELPSVVSSSSPSLANNNNKNKNDNAAVSTSPLDAATASLTFQFGNKSVPLPTNALNGVRSATSGTDSSSPQIAQSPTDANAAMQSLSAVAALALLERDRSGLSHSTEDEHSMSNAALALISANKRHKTGDGAHTMSSFQSQNLSSSLDPLQMRAASLSQMTTNANEISLDTPFKALNSLADWTNVAVRVLSVVRHNYPDQANNNDMVNSINQLIDTYPVRAQSCIQYLQEFLAVQEQHLVTQNVLVAALQRQHNLFAHSLESLHPAHSSVVLSQGTGWNARATERTQNSIANVSSSNRLSVSFDTPRPSTSAASQSSHSNIFKTIPADLTYNQQLNSSTSTPRSSSASTRKRKTTSTEDQALIRKEINLLEREIHSYALSSHTRSAEITEAERGVTMIIAKRIFLSEHSEEFGLPAYTTDTPNGVWLLGFYSEIIDPEHGNKKWIFRPLQSFAIFDDNDVSLQLIETILDLLEDTQLVLDGLCFSLSINGGDLTRMRQEAFLSVARLEQMQGQHNSSIFLDKIIGDED